MVVIPNLYQLKKKRDQLLEERAKLVEQIKSSHHDFYLWAIANNIDLSNLKEHSANIAAAFVISASSVLGIYDIPGDLTLSRPEQTFKVIETSELQGLTDAQKAALVWERYGPIIEKTADKYRLDQRLVFSTIMLESGGNTNAIRHEPQIGDASYGLGQILYGTAKGIGFEGKPNDLFDPETNIDLIAKYHRRNMDVYGPELTPEQLTTAYNAGSPYSYALPGHLTKFERWYREARHLIV